MDIRSRVAILGVAVLLGCSPGTVDQASTDGVLVPAELTIALLGVQDSGAEIFVGEAPEEVLSAVSILPPGAVVGGLMREDGGTVVVQLDDFAGDLTAYTTALEEAGWERGVTGSGFRGGFVGSQQSSTSLLCSGTHSLRATVSAREGAAYARVHYSALQPGPTPCDNARFRAEMGPGRYGLVLPTLHPPADAEVRPSGGGGSSNGVDMDVLVRTSLSGAELFEHYSKQLRDAGWRSTEAMSERQASIGLWSTTDELGNPAVGVFAVWTLLADGEYRAWIRLERGE